MENKSPQILKIEIEAELSELKRELIEVCNDIKDCTDSENRKKLFEDKKEIQEDIDITEKMLVDVNVILQDANLSTAVPEEEKISETQEPAEPTQNN